MEYGMNRTLRIEVRVSPEEYDILDRVAKKKQATASEYLRWMAMWAAIKSGDRGALSFAAKRIKEDHQDRMDSFYAAMGLPGVGKRKVSAKDTAE
jgi:hypothetical protein